ncbi:alpha/beta hydrolase [Amycolatopsis cihanbeyliensis]|uniref:alpha/beta hydrolase n=1 Tax=Amycolatopsis cihanbeyliensis TaxID=1128664 RepID=UPI001FECD944|nr:alpha/beta hydrolase [Amycolatopsis cihanbeyliensis]
MTTPGPAASRRARWWSRISSVTLRPLTAALPASERGVRLSRRIVAGSLAVLGPVLPGTEVRGIDLADGGGSRVRGEWVHRPRVRREGTVLLYLHGSGYAVCSARTHRGLTSRLAAMTGLPVFACDYRLAPRHRFPAAADDVRAAYDWLRAHGHPGERVVVAGDSAGGHLALDLTLELLRSRSPAPAAVVLFSPLVDPSLELARRRERSRPDPMISAERARRMVALYTRDTDAAHPRLALGFDGVAGFPPTLIQAGGAEMLAADAEHLARSLRAAGAHCELEIWPGQMHVFQALPLLIPEARPALATAAGFIRRQACGPRRAEAS